MHYCRGVSFFELLGGGNYLWAISKNRPQVNSPTDYSISAILLHPTADIRRRYMLFLRGLFLERLNDSIGASIALNFFGSFIPVESVCL